MARSGRSAPLFWATLGLAVIAAGGAHATVNLLNGQGATAPCVGIGPIGGPAAEHCGQMFEAQGFVRVEAVGFSGLTIGGAGPDDGVITKIAAGSPAALAGLAVGDVIVAVDDKPVIRTPGSIAAERVFAPRGSKLALSFRRNGAPTDVSLTLAAETPPSAPHWDAPLVVNRPLINWRGDIVPCVGVGPLAPAALAYCTSHFKSFGFVPLGDFGGAGLKFDQARSDKAVVSEVKAESPAAKARVQVGDELLTVGGAPLATSRGAAATEALFGKLGDVRRLTVRRAGTDRTVPLTLAPKGK